MFVCVQLLQPAAVPVTGTVCHPACLRLTPPHHPTPPPPVVLPVLVVVLVWRVNHRRWLHCLLVEAEVVHTGHHHHHGPSTLMYSLVEPPPDHVPTTYLLNPLTPTVVIWVQLCARPGQAVICYFWHPGTLTLSPERQSARMSKITNDGLTRSGTGCFIAVPIWQQWASKRIDYSDFERCRSLSEISVKQLSVVFF